MTRSHVELRNKLLTQDGDGIEKVRADVEQLREECGQVSARLKRAKMQRDALRKEMSKNTERLSLLRKPLKEEESFEEENATFNQHIQRLSQNTSSLISLFDSENTLFFSKCNMSMDEYMTLEKKLDRTEFVGMTESKHTVRSDQSQELVRLQNAMADSKLRRLFAEMDLEKVRARKRSQDSEEMSFDSNKLKMLSRSLKQDLKECVEFDLVPLLRDMGKIQSSKVILEEYSLLLEDQTIQYDRICREIDWLRNQENRLKLLFNCLLFEKNQIKHISNLINTINAALMAEAKRHKNKLNYMEKCSNKSEESNASGLENLISKDFQRDLESERKRKQQKKEQLKKQIEYLNSCIEKGRNVLNEKDSFLEDYEKCSVDVKKCAEVIGKIEKRRNDHESYQKSLTNEIVIVEKSMMYLFWDNPSNPQRLNQTLQKLKEKLGV